MSSTEVVSSFIEGSPPGELTEVVKSIKALTSDSDPSLLQNPKVKAAFQRYNESQLVCAKLPGGTQHVLVSEHNRLDDTTYYDTTTSTSFTFDHLTQKPSNSKSYTHDSPRSDLIASISKSLASHFAEHYPTQSSAGSAYTVSESSSSDSAIAILISATKSSPNNFISGRWRTMLLYDPSSQALTGTLSAQVHYYEDGNVALNTTRKVSESNVGNSGAEIVRKVAQIEKQYQEEVNRALVGMNEGSFRGLRRQLPVTRQRIEWEKVRGYSLSDNLKGK
ncbi:F-actin-capping protein subunit alpha [Exophiala xenobiotica]|uniref:F-actin-capping protein subunit alpha n=1 Tax=Lithohypha guttulata TaxID=1690604 RepID=A0ABR0KLB1_9EURO|nr:F-actin-capping protein subunit alpha [Lithohypha guttulata]KAK5324670.1 F-actin-capping protein subunit alpha [Exophiala xenobiotica]